MQLVAGLDRQSPDEAGIRSWRLMSTLDALLEQLHELNDRTWRMAAGDLESILINGAEKDAPLEAAARFGYAVMEKLARTAVEVQLPMELDY